MMINVAVGIPSTQSGILSMSITSMLLASEAVNVATDTLTATAASIDELYAVYNTFNSSVIDTAKTSQTPDYLVYYNRDSGGNDIKQVSGNINDFIIACDNDINCLGFNSSGWLKNKVNILAPYKYYNNNQGAFYLKNQPKNLNNIKPDYAYYKNFDSNGYDIYKISGDTINYLSACNSRDLCIGFNANGYLKKNIKNNLDKTSDSGIYVKKKSISNPYKLY